MAMQQSFVEPKAPLQRVSLIWKKERQTMERTINYFDESDGLVELPWDRSNLFYEGTAEFKLGEHLGSLLISDHAEGPIFSVHPFEVNKLNLGEVQKILLVIDTNPAASIPQSVSSPASENIPSPVTPYDDVLVQSQDAKRIESVTDTAEMDTALLNSLDLAKKEQSRLEGDKRSLMEECARVKAEKQAIKEESFEIDEQLIAAMEQLTAYERQQALMEERHNALLREARVVEEDNLAMRAIINEKDSKCAMYCETIKQMESEIKYCNGKIQQFVEEKETLVTKCNYLEHQCATSEKIEVFQAEELEQAKEKQRLEKELNIIRSDSEKLLGKDIPSLQQDIRDLRQQIQTDHIRYQQTLNHEIQKNGHLQKEMKELRSFLNMEEDQKKNIDQEKNISTRDSMKLIDQLSRHFDGCTDSLKKLVNLLEANVDAKENQLVRRFEELKEARDRNNFLVQEVLSRGHNIARLTKRLQTIISEPGLVTSQTAAFSDHQTKTIPEAIPNYPSNFNPAPFAMPTISDSTVSKPALPSPSDLIKYAPVIKSVHRDLPTVTNKVIDFKNTPIQVLKMKSLEDPKSHIGKQVICMLNGNYVVGTLRTVFEYRPSMGGLKFSPMTIIYAGVQFDEAIGESDGSFKGTSYFQCPDNHAEFISDENVYLHI